MSDVEDIARCVGKVVEVRAASDESRGLKVHVIKLPFGTLFAPGFDQDGKDAGSVDVKADVEAAEENKVDEEPEANYFAKLWPACE